VAELLECPETVLGVGLADHAIEPPYLLPLGFPSKEIEHPLRVQAGVPDVEVALAGEGPHGLPVPGDRGRHDAATLPRLESELAAGDGEAGGQAFDVPLPRPGNRLVEVVDAEGHLSA
jgi:hypothetical protein